MGDYYNGVISYYNLLLKNEYNKDNEEYKHIIYNNANYVISNTNDIMIKENIFIQHADNIGEKITNLKIRISSYELECQRFQCRNFLFHLGCLGNWCDFYEHIPLIHSKRSKILRYTKRSSSKLTRNINFHS